MEPGQRVFIPDMVEIGLVTYRALWRHTHDDLFARMACIPTAIDVREQFPPEGPPPSKADLKAIMDSHTHTDGAKINHMTSFWAAKELIPVLRRVASRRAGAGSTGLNNGLATNRVRFG